MRKLVIGCGYLGERVARNWSLAGDEVFALTRSSQRAEEFRRHGWQPVVGDVTRPETLKNLPTVDVVLYAVGFDRSSGLSQREIYVEGLQNALDALGERIRRWLYISSTSVYGQENGEWIDETSPACPTRLNGQICREAEQRIEQFFPAGEQASRSANILRLAGIYGPGRLRRRLSQLKSGQPPSGDPEGWLNLIHVDDAVQTVLACEQRGRPGGVYLVCDDQPVHRREFYSQLREGAGGNLPAFDRAVPAGGGEGRGKRCSNRKIREELGVQLIYPTISAGLSQALAPVSEDPGPK